MEQLTLFGADEVGRMLKLERKRLKCLGYADFVEKFVPKKTTDDCYTPELVFDAVADYACKRYGFDRSAIVRPFYPGGDYMSFDYPEDCVVLDNPPFSILKQIISFYMLHEIRFFLFAPTLNGLTRYSDLCTVLVCGVQIVYENGAQVNTSFATNMEPPDIRARTCPALYCLVDEAVKATLKEQRREIPRYIYPLSVISPAYLYPYSRLGIDFVLPRSESVRIDALDSMRALGKSIFGSGWLLSERLTAEREKAEREKATVWQLSDRERAIIAELSSKEDEKWLNGK